MNDSTSRPDADDPRPGDRGEIGRAAARQLIATFVQVDDQTVGALVERLPDDDDERITSVLDAVLSDPDRLRALHGTGLMDEPSSPTLDRIARMTAEALGTPLAAVALVDRDSQFLAGCNVADADFPRTRPLQMSFSKFVVASGRPMVVDDASTHRLLRHHPAVRSGLVRAYAGVPLIGADGHAIGALCTWDGRPRHWSSGQIQILTDFAQVVCTKVFTSLS